MAQSSIDSYDDDFETAPNLPNPPQPKQSLSSKHNLQSLLLLEETLALELSLLTELNTVKQQEHNKIPRSTIDMGNVNTVKSDWQIGQRDPAIIDDGTMFSLPPSLGKQIEGKKHRKTAPRVPMATASSSSYDLRCFLDRHNNTITSGFQPSMVDLPGPGFYTPINSKEEGKGAINFGKSAPRGLLVGVSDVDHRKIDLLNLTKRSAKQRSSQVYRSKPTSFDHGRINPVHREKQVNKKLGPGSFDPLPVRPKAASATFGAPPGGTVYIQDFAQAAEDSRREAAAAAVHNTFNDFTLRKRTPGTPMGRNNATSGVGGSNNASSGSFRSRAAILDRGRTLPELLEQTRQDLYYKDKESRDYVNHDSAIGNQRLSRRKNAPTGVKW
jgi:hypothetical protein